MYAFLSLYVLTVSAVISASKASCFNSYPVAVARRVTLALPLCGWQSTR